LRGAERSDTLKRGPEQGRPVVGEKKIMNEEAHEVPALQKRIANIEKLTKGSLWRNRNHQELWERAQDPVRKVGGETSRPDDWFGENRGLR